MNTEERRDRQATGQQRRGGRKGKPIKEVETGREYQSQSRDQKACLHFRLGVGCVS